MKKIRLGLVGCGGMMSAHARSFHLLGDVEITAACDTNPTQLKKRQQALEGIYVTTDYTTMVDYVDAVLVALPHHLHYGCGVFFARHKKHILMEKPLCNTEEECLRLIQVCEEEKVVLMCAYPVRHWTGIVKLKELLDSGKYGKPFMMSVWTEQLTILDELHWGASGCLGGGQLFSHGCHYIDLLLWFLGKPVSGTHVGTNVGTPWMLREGTSAVTIKFESGAIAYHGATWGARGSRMGSDFQIHTEKAMLEFHKESGEVRVYDQEAPHVPGIVSSEQGYTVVWKRPERLPTKETQHEIRHFLDCIRTGQKPVTDGYTALQGLRVIWKLYDAEKQGIVADLRDCALPE